MVSSSPIKQPLRFKRVYACATTTAENSKSSDKVETRDTTIISWNVNSLRALIRKDPLALEKLVKQYKPDLLCLQETKLQEEHEELFKDLLKDDLPLALFNSSTTRLGYSGTAVYANVMPKFIQTTIRHDTGDGEGRVLALDFSGIVLINVYTMNSGQGLRRLDIRQTWDAAFRRFVREHITMGYEDVGKPVIIVGDLNVAHTVNDVHDATKVRGLPGFTDTERDSFNDLLETASLVDAYRLKFPDVSDKYTFWDYRSSARKVNRGWRIDYTLISDSLVDTVKHVDILDHVQGSDHCPVLITLGPGLIDYSLVP